MRKIIATDMDGTFLDRTGSYDRERFARVLDSLESRDWLMTIASGRGMLALDKLFAPYKHRLAMVAENGSVVRYDGQVLFKRQLSSEQCLDIIQALADNPYGSSQLFLLSGQLGAYIIEGADPDYIEHEKRYHENIRIVSSFDAIDDTIIKITAHLHPEQMVEGTAWLNQRLSVLGLRAVTTGFEAIDIIPDDVDKGLGLQKLCEALGLSRKDVIAFGDNLNDIEMLTFAGQSIAVANARPEVLDLADKVIGHHDSGVVLEELEYLLQNH